VTELRAGFSRPADGQWRGGALGTRPTTPRGGGGEDDFCVVLDTIYAKITEKDNGTRFSCTCRCCGLLCTPRKLAPLSHIHSVTPTPNIVSSPTSIR
jgi:hypothetical protein